MAIEDDRVPVAVKVQYVNISNSIESDINNLIGTLKLFKSEQKFIMMKRVFIIVNGLVLLFDVNNTPFPAERKRYDLSRQSFEFRIVCKSSR